MKIHYKAFAVVAAAILPAVVIPAAQAASASAATPASANSAAGVQHAFNVVGFDAAVAKAHGYKIVTYANGSEQSVPINSQSGLKPSPVVNLQDASEEAASATPGVVSPDAVTQDTVYGNCGYSYIEGEKSATHQIWLNSGFSITPAPAVRYNWTIELEDKNGSSYQGSNGEIDSYSWSDTWSGLNQYSYSFDDVLTSSSATLSNGEVCASGGPGIFLNSL
jgi:hypothetical protein